MEEKSVETYLAGHDTVEIKVGKSGADVYEIDGKYIIKHVLRKKLEEEELFDTYLREAYFYQSNGKNSKSYRPEMLDVAISQDEIILVMKKYDRIERSAVSDKLLRKIMNALARVHTDEIPVCLQQDRKKAEPLSAQKIAECMNGWKAVLAEHPGVFDEFGLTKLTERINDIILWHDTEECVLCHGDFHWDNLLTDENGDIVICDWQGVGEGKASGDLSFFISRLGADGVWVDEKKLLKYYAEEIYELSGRCVDREEIMGHMDAANRITSFLFWHQYLHGNPEERVRKIYGQMTDGFLIRRYCIHSGAK